MGISVYLRLDDSPVISSLSATYAKLAQRLDRLSSGLRINWAWEGPADLVISERLRSQIASLNQEIENISGLIGRYETASSYISEMRSHLTELRSLAVAAANEGANPPEVQQTYAVSASDIVSSYNRIRNTAEYAGSKLLDGSDGALVNVSELEGVDLSSAESAHESIAAIDGAIAELDTAQIDLGTAQKHDLQARKASLEVTVQNLQAAESAVRDLDFAWEYSAFVVDLIKLEVGAALLAHSYMRNCDVLNLIGE